MRRLLKLFIILILFLNRGIGVFGDQIKTLEINSERDSYPLGQYLQILKDNERNITFQDILSGKYDDRFLDNKDQIPNYGYSSSIFWVRFKLKPVNIDLSNYLVDFTYPMMEKTVFYEMNSNGDYKTREYGDHLLFSERELVHRNMVFFLSSSENREPVYYFRMETEGSMRFPLKIWERTAFTESKFKVNYLLGIFYGFFLIMFLFNMLLFYFVKDRSYLYCSLFLLFYGLFNVLQNGVFAEIINPVEFSWKFGLYICLTLVGMIFAILFAISFLHLKKITPVLNKFFIGFMCFIGVMILWSLITKEMFPVRIRILASMLFVWAISNVVAGIATLIKGYRAARFFLAGWIGFIIGVFIFALQSYGIIQSTGFTLYSMQISSIFIVILLPVALADRIAIIQAEKNTAQRLSIIAQEKVIFEHKHALEVQTNMTTSFSRFVPVEFLKSLKKENLTDIKLGDQVEKRMTILFSDIRSFTSLSETMSPKDNFKFLNSFLERMVPCILRNHGFVDKFVGDAIMALFPDNPADAISAAIDMQTEIQKMNKDMDIMVEKKISIGIGIHVGDLMLGTIGVTDRMETTVISDAVNVAARMERLTKLYNTGILITGDTLMGLDKFQSRYLDTVRVKGKNIPNSVYEILDGLEPDLLEQRIQSRDDFDCAVRNYRNGDIQKAKDQFEELIKINNTDKTIELYIERCKHLLENGIPEHWDCIEKLSSK